MHGTRAQQLSHRAKQHELSAAYAALAVELTKTEIRHIGGYSLGRVIGEGTFGKVRLGVHRLTGTRVAIKQVPKSLPSYSPSDPSSPLSLLTREIHHHRRLRHPNVLALYELVATESSIYLVTELCAGGELFDYLVESTQAPPGSGGLALAETRRIFGQLVLGVAYLHSEGVVHRDLKLENVLLDEHVNVKIADMGFGREFERGRWLETKVGTLAYTAPEIVAGHRYLGEQVDIWSLGVILFALLTGSLPFDDDDETVMRSLILSCTYTVPAFLDRDAADLVSRILVADPLRRPSLRDILAHPFFTGVPAPPSMSSLPVSTTARAPLAPSVLAASSSRSPPPSPLGDPVTPLASASSPSARSYFASPASSPEGATLSAVAAGKRRADAPALPPHLVASTGPSASTGAGPSGASVGAGAAAASPLRRHPSTASIDFGPSAPPVVRSQSGSGAGAGTGAASVHSSGGGQGAAPVRRRRSAGAASSRSVLIPATAEVGTGAEGHGPAGVAGAGAIAPARVDYLAQLASPSGSGRGAAPALLSSPADQALLGLLAEVGFDAGQVAHSVRTSACDACAAAWWMLRRKRDEAEVAAGVGASVSRASSVRSAARDGRGRRSTLGVQPEPDDEERSSASDSSLDSDSDSGAEDAFLARPAPPGVALPDTIAEEERRASIASFASSSSAAPPSTPPPRRPSAAGGAPGTPSTPLADPSPAAAAARLSYFLQQGGDGDPDPATTAGVNPLLSYFPPVDGASPTKPRGGAGASVERSTGTSREALLDATGTETGVATAPAAAAVTVSMAGLESPEAGANAAVLAPGPAPEGARRRIGSVGMLARAATSALAHGGVPNLDLPPSSSASACAGGLSTGGSSTPPAEESAPAPLPPRQLAPPPAPQDHRPRAASVSAGPGEEVHSLPKRASPLTMSGPSGAPPSTVHAHTPPAPGQGASAAHVPTLPSPAPPLPPLGVVAPPLSGDGSDSPAARAQPDSESLSPSPSPSGFVSATGSGPGSASRQTASPTTTSSSSLAAAAAASLGRSTSLRFGPGPGPSGGGGRGGGKMGLKGANLLSTFKLWFGQSAATTSDPRKRANGPGTGAKGKRSPLLTTAPSPVPTSGPLANTVTGATAGAGGGVVRSQSMYVGSPLRHVPHPHGHAYSRPGMGSRRSSNNSVSGGGGGGGGGAASVSRRSSVSSARGYAPTGPPRTRRTSDASRTSASERAAAAGLAPFDGSGGGAGGGGPSSRPGSVRSFGARRYRHHSKAPSGSSAASLLGLDLASAGTAGYRRPPTTTTVRRRHGGSHGRGSSETARTPSAGHRRTRSSASSTYRSSGSEVADADSDFEDEVDEADGGGGGGEDPILEEDEPALEDAPAASYVLPGAYNTPSPPPARTHSTDRLVAAALVASRASSLRSGSPSSSRSRSRPRPGPGPGSNSHAPTTFTAHKTTHLFGSPLQPRASAAA
ncbi:hypothetical protein JCM3770_003989, partial [Rhodotorula araucariae]